MNKLICATVSTFALVAGSAHAANNSTSDYIEIQNLGFFSKDDPILLNWRGFVSVTFTQPLAWTVPGVCNQTMVAVRPTDTHLIAAVQTAYASGKGLRVYVDDSQRLDSAYCILRAVQY
jgi:hypothetical protein